MIMIKPILYFILFMLWTWFIADVEEKKEESETQQIHSNDANSNKQRY